MRLNELTRVNRTIAVCLLTLTVLVGLFALSFAKVFLAPTLVALLLALTLSPIVRSLEVRGLGPEPASALVMLATLSGVVALGYALAPSYEVWRAKFPEIADTIKERFREVGEQLEEVSETAKAVQEAAESATGATASSETASSVVAPTQVLLEWLAEAPAIVATILYVALLAFFVMSERETLLRAVVGLMPNVRRRRHLLRALRDMRSGVSRYLLTITLINVGLGVVATGAFYAIGLPNAPLWGALAALLNYIPFLGPAMTACVVFVVGLVSYDDITMAFAPVAIVVALNVIEGQILTPMIVGRSTSVSSLAVFLGVSFGAWLWGPVGALLATPTLIVARIWVDRFDFLPQASDQPKPAKKLKTSAARR